MLQELGIVSEDTTFGELFSDPDIDTSWSELEQKIANILRNGRKNALYLLDKREKLLCEVLVREITPEDEKIYESLGKELEKELEEVKKVLKNY